MRILAWRPRTPAPARQRPTDLRFPARGDYAGRARYLPGDTTGLLPALREAAGQLVDVRFIGMAPPGPYQGQALYRDCTGLLLGDTPIPEQDLDFVE
jgi:hypothetical protein